MVKVAIVFIAFTTVVVVSSAIGWSVYNYKVQDRDLDPDMKWKWDPEIQAPPDLIYQKEDLDNTACMETVMRYWLKAKKIWEQYGEDQMKLNDSYETILEKMEEYGIDLVNNADFEDWAGMHSNGILHPVDPIEYSETVREYWGDSSDPLEHAKPFYTVKQIKKAFKRLFKWRIDNLLELTIASRRLSIEMPDESEYATCSVETKKIAQKLLRYSKWALSDLEVKNYYPLLDDIIDWLDEQKIVGLDEKNEDGMEEQNADGLNEQKEDGRKEQNEDGLNEQNEDGMEELNADGLNEQNEDGMEEQNADGLNEQNEDGLEDSKEDGLDEQNEDGQA